VTPHVYPREFRCYNISVVNHDALLNSVLIARAAGNMVERNQARGRMEMSLERRGTGQHLSVYKDELRSNVGYAQQDNCIRTYDGMYSLFAKLFHGVFLFTYLFI
jgi:hypothetical protein